MNTGGRRRLLGPLLSGPACCALVVVVLSLWLGAVPNHATTDSANATTISHAVATAHLAARPLPPDQAATLATSVALVISLGLVLVLRRRAVLWHRPQHRRPTGRAPPGPLAHL